MNSIDNLDQQLDILHDLILTNLGEITDCKTRQILIDLFSYQTKTASLLMQIMEKRINDLLHTIPISESETDQNIN